MGSTAALLAVALVMLVGQTGSQARVPDACTPGTETPDKCLPYSRGFLITGDYAVAGVDLKNPTETGLATGEIEMSGVPQDADILAAYLYWESIAATATPGAAEVGVKFRGQDIAFDDVVAVKKSTRALNDATAQCFSSGTPLTMTMFRADVLRFLPIRLDANDKSTGKRLVNKADLDAHGEALLTVTLPLKGGNQIPESAGASLLVVYRSPNPAATLRKIVIYDGIYVQKSIDDADNMFKTIQGFYKAADTASARLTHIVGSGQPNGNERILFNGPGPLAEETIAPTVSDPQEPFFGGTASQRAWATKTINIDETLMDSASSINALTEGETVTTTVDHTGGGGYDCLSWAAVIFSTTVEDADDDGLPDALEQNTGTGGLLDPDGVVLPDLEGMLASPSQKDIFIEVNAMWAAAGTSYGAVPNNVTDGVGHNHMPTPEVLKMVADAYVARGITPHFDVGNLTNYHAENEDPYDPQKFGVVQHTDWVDDYTSDVADAFLIPTGFAKGGEVIKETACVPSQSNPCHFQHWPGTVGWKFGLQALRDAPVGNDGEELQPADFASWETSGTSQHRRRFDRVRRGLFHYVLYAHARGRPKSALPCLVNGDPAPYPANQTSCAVDNPAFHIPSSASGIADQPGGNAMITLGLWDEFVARPFVRAATTLHELGHNLDLWHGGLPASWGNKAANPPTATYVEPNCKPNYLSSMSYLYQVHGLFDDDDTINISYSSASHPFAGHINEASVSDGKFSMPTPLYRPAWYAPADSALATSQGVSAAARFCSGGKFFSTTLNDGDGIDQDDMSIALTNASGVPLPPTPFHVIIDSEVILLDACVGNTCSVQTREAAGTIAASHSSAAPVTVTYIPGMARVVADTTTTDIDWDGDGTNDSANQDVNYDNTAGQTLFGVNDLDRIRLNQTGAGHNFAALSDGSGDIALVEGDIALVEGDIALVEGDIALVEGDIALVEGDVALVEGDIALVEGDIALVEGDIALVEGQEAPLTLEAAKGLGRTAPHGVTTCVIDDDDDCSTTADAGDPLYHRVELNWNPTTVGGAIYEAQRKVAGAPDSTYAPVTLVDCPDVESTTCAIDSAELPDGVQFTYRMRATFAEAPFNSGWSKPTATPAIAANVAPVAVADNGAPYVVNSNSPATTFAAPAVLANDTDDDSPICPSCPLNPGASFRARRAELLGPGTPVLNLDGSRTTTTTAGGTVRLWPDGKFEFTPKKGYDGPDSFTYKSDDGVWHLDTTKALSEWSSPATVTITVKKKGK